MTLRYLRAITNKLQREAPYTRVRTIERLQRRQQAESEHARRAADCLVVKHFLHELGGSEMTAQLRAWACPPPRGDFDVVRATRAGVILRDSASPSDNPVLYLAQVDRGEVRRISCQCMSCFGEGSTFDEGTETVCETCGGTGWGVAESPRPVAAPRR